MSKIPNKIHYCWFGRNPKPEIVLNCISTWKKFFPGWEIIEWNEDNYDINNVLFVKEAYEAKKWAFVSDYVRFDVLYKYGGVYLDTDVEFLKKLPDEYLELDAFTGFECTGIIAPGLIFAVIPEFPMIKQIISQYENEHFYINNKGIYKTINLRITELLEQNGLEKKDELQTINNLTVFPSEFFCGYDTDIREPNITQNTISYHHYLGSWSKIPTKTKLQNILKRIIGKKIYKKLILIKRRMIQ